MWCFHVFFFKQKTAYEMRISDWSSDVCSSDLHLLLNCAGIQIAQTMVADPHIVNDRLVMERAAFWTGQTHFDGFVREYNLLFRLEVHRVTGDSWISFRRPDGMLVSAAPWAVTPSARGVPAIFWPSFAVSAQGRLPALLPPAA